MWKIRSIIASENTAAESVRLGDHFGTTCELQVEKHWSTRCVKHEGVLVLCVLILIDQYFDLIITLASISEIFFLTAGNNMWYH
jgi:hypothetical protein